MSKRTALKTLAFLCGLYFILEFFLPEKVGGDFDSYAVHSPVMVQTASGPTLFYAGQYRREEGAVGRLVRAEDGTWLQEPREPVLPRSLFVPHDHWGMEHLDAVTNGTALHLFYFGRNAQLRPVLCHAEGDPSGTSWRKTAPPLFTRTGVPPSPTLDEPNGLLPGELMFFSADHAGDGWRILLVTERKGQGVDAWTASGERLDLLELAPEPMPLPQGFFKGCMAFDAELLDEGWRLHVLTEEGIQRLRRHPRDGNTLEEPVPVADADGVTGLRYASDTETYYLSVKRLPANPPRPEDAAHDTFLLALDPGEDANVTEIRSTGAPPVPTYLSRGVEQAGNWLQVIGSFAVFLAMINLTIFHGKKTMRRQPGWVNSLVFFVFMASMMLLTFKGQPEAAQGTYWRNGFDFLFDSIQRPMGTAVFSMITFYMISAAYRSFRIRSVDAALLMFSAFIVMVGQMPFGTWLGQWLPESAFFLQFPWLAEKLLNVVNASAYRGVMIGLALGGFAISIRVWLGLDNSVYSGLEGKE